MIQVAQIAFAKARRRAEGGAGAGRLLGPLKWVGLGLAPLIFCFFMRALLKRRENETLAEPSWLLDRPTPLAALEAEAGAAQRRADAGAARRAPEDREAQPSSSSSSVSPSAWPPRSARG